MEYDTTEISTSNTPSGFWPPPSATPPIAVEAKIKPLVIIAKLKINLLGNLSFKKNIAKSVEIGSNDEKKISV